MHARRNWLIVLFVAGALRLWGLANAPLSPSETHRALQALSVVRGSGWPMAPDSPLVLIGNVLGFSIFGPGNGTARLIAALGGWSIVGLPYFWRKQLGSVGALTAAALLAISPLLLFASRQVDGMTWGVLGAGLLAAAMRDESSSRQRAALTVAGVAVGLTGGPAFFDLLLAWGLAQVVARRDVPLAFPWRAMVGGIGAAMPIAVGWGLHPQGWGDIGAGAAAWWHAWMSGGTHWSPWAYLLYEPLTVLLALVGLGFAWQRRNPLPLRWAWWGGFALLLTGLRPSDSALLLGAASVPLALLAGYGMKVALTEIVPSFRGWVAVQATLGFALWLTGGQLLTQHAKIATTSLWPFLVLIVLQIILGVMFGLTIPPRWAGRGFLLGVAAALLLLQISFAWGVAFVRPASPAELIIAQAGSPDLTNLHRTLESLMFRDGLRKDAQPLTLVADGDIKEVVAWTLRDFPRLQVTGTWPEDVADLVLTAEQITPPESVRKEGWQGMRFVATTQLLHPIPACPQGQLVCSARTQWLLFRQGSAPPTQHFVILWERPAH